MRQTELRLRALAGELEECRQALRRAVAGYDEDRRRRRTRRRRLALPAVLVVVFAAGLTAADAPSFGAPARLATGATCAPGPGSLVDASFSYGDRTVTATFTVGAGCSSTLVSLASYAMVAAPSSMYPQTLYDSASAEFGPGTHTLQVSLPDCYWQADLMTGQPLETIDPAGDAAAFWRNHYATAIGAKGGHSVCLHVPPPTTTTTTTGTTTTTTIPTTTSSPTTTTTTTPTTTTSIGTTTVTTPATTTTTSAPAPPPPAATDVAVTKVADRTSAVVGQQVSYLLTVVNNGPAAAASVVLVDQVPEQESVVSLSDPACSGATVVTCNLGTLAVGASRAVTLVALARTPGTATNVATVTTTTPETTTGNNQAQVSVPIAGPLVPPPTGPKCAVLGVRHGKLVAGRRSTLLVTARRDGEGVSGVRIRARGPGIDVVRTTGAGGRATFVVTPRRTGVLSLRALQRPSCPATLSELSVPGAFRPPLLTG